MPRILILFASTHGHTAKIAARIAATLQHDGASVDLHPLHAHETQPAPTDYDAVILGASIHAGHYQRALVKWAEQHHTALGLTPSAFFSVCLTAADDTEESRAATRGYLDDFIEQTGWTPGRSATFAGAVQYHEYDIAHPRADATADATHAPPHRHVAGPRLHRLGRRGALGARARRDAHPHGRTDMNAPLRPGHSPGREQAFRARRLGRKSRSDGMTSRSSATRS